MAHLDPFEQVLINPALAALDAGRAAILKRIGRLSKGFLVHRNWRAVALAAFACTFALVATVGATGYLLLLGPILFGAPHLVSEARYLFFQRYRSDPGLLVVLALQATLAFAGVGVQGLGLCTALAILCTSARDAKNGRAPISPARKAALLGLALLIQCGALIAPTSMRFLLLHVHNCVPIVLWLSWRERPKGVSFVVMALLVAAVLTLLGGMFDACAVQTPLRDDVFSLTKITDAVAGGFHGPWRHRFLLLFAFTQSLHYAFWLRMIPEEARARETPRTWGASWRAFKADSGASVAQLAVVAVIAVPVFAFALGVVRARSFYVRVSEFHATVEMVLVCLGFCYARARDPRSLRHATSSLRARVPPVNRLPIM